MSDYIEREVTVNALDDLCDMVCQYSKELRWMMCGACPLGCAFDVITDNIPAADVQPVKHGRWIKPTRVPGSMLDECSVCGFNCGAYTFNYCPYCGAKMDEGTE